MGGAWSEEVGFLAEPDEVHDFVFSLPRDATVGIEHIERSPLTIHELHDLGLESGA